MHSRSSLLEKFVPLVPGLPSSHRSLKVGELRCLSLSMVALRGYAEDPERKDPTGC